MSARRPGMSALRPEVCACRATASVLAAFALLSLVSPLSAQTSPPAPPNPIAPPAIPMPAIPVPPKPPTIVPPAAATPPKDAVATAAETQAVAEKGRAASETAGFLSLLGFGDDDNQLLRGMSGLGGSGAKDGTDALLERLLEKMDAAENAKPNAAKPAKPAAGNGTERREGAAVTGDAATVAVEVLRCVVNGHDLERGFSGSFVSTRAGDGSFLVTGERYLVLEGVRRREVVYLLYRPGAGDAGSLYVDVSQEVPNEESFFRRLSLSGPVPATAIGDLVVCRASRGDLVADFLFRARSATVRKAPGR